MLKISDFNIPCLILKSCCKALDCPFMDLELDFDLDQDDNCDNIYISSGKIHVSNPDSLSKLMLRIVFLYLHHFSEMFGKSPFVSDEQKNVTNGLITDFIGYLCKDELQNEKAESTIMRLSQFPIIWILMADIIQPVYEVEQKNTMIICTSCAYIDAAKYVGENDIVSIEKLNKCKEPFIFLNADLRNTPYQTAALFIEAIRAWGLEPYRVLQDILSSDLREKLVGAAKLAFDTDDKVYSFVVSLITLSGVSNQIEQLTNPKDVGKDLVKHISKFAQYGFGSDRSGNSWWYLGLIENLLSPTRGPDFTTHKSLEELAAPLRKRLAEERKKSGRDGLNYEALLEIKNKDEDEKVDNPHIKDISILEKLLSTDRIW